MKPIYHARSSAKKFGGRAEDYLEIHNWFDSTKAHCADIRHRMMLHNSWGIFLCEQIFGVTIKNSNGRDVPVRSIGEQHVVEDLGRIPTLSEILDEMPILNWLGGPIKGKKIIQVQGVRIEEHEQ